MWFSVVLCGMRIRQSFSDSSGKKASLKAGLRKRALKEAKDEAEDAANCEAARLTIQAEEQVVNRQRDDLAVANATFHARNFSVNVVQLPAAKAIQNEGDSMGEGMGKSVGEVESTLEDARENMTFVLDGLGLR